MAKIEYLNYDENVDHLTIYKANETIFINKDLGLAILSLNKKNQIVGIELMGVNKNLGVPLAVLKNMNGGRVQIRYNPQEKLMVISIFLKYQKKSNPIVYSSAIDLGKTAFSETLGYAAT